MGISGEYKVWELTWVCSLRQQRNCFEFGPRYRNSCAGNLRWWRYPTKRQLEPIFRLWLECLWYCWRWLAAEYLWRYRRRAVLAVGYDMEWIWTTMTGAYVHSLTTDFEMFLFPKLSSKTAVLYDIHPCPSRGFHRTAIMRVGFELRFFSNWTYSPRSHQHQVHK